MNFSFSLRLKCDLLHCFHLIYFFLFFFVFEMSKKTYITYNVQCTSIFFCIILSLPVFRSIFFWSCSFFPIQFKGKKTTWHCPFHLINEYHESKRKECLTSPQFWIDIGWNLVFGIFSFFFLQVDSNLSTVVFIYIFKMLQKTRTRSATLKTSFSTVIFRIDDLTHRHTHRNFICRIFAVCSKQQRTTIEEGEKRNCLYISFVNSHNNFSSWTCVIT